jgi:hypothetical protein
MASQPNQKPLLGPSDMHVVEHVLNMAGGYVLDFSDRTFDQFIAHEVGVDATAPRYSEDGGSKARRLRSILASLQTSQLVKLLRAFLDYRDSPARIGRVSVLEDEWRKAYENVIGKLEKHVLDTNTTFAASSWTGIRTLREQVAIVRGLAPVALTEIDTLADLIEQKRFNDPITADAIQCLRELHEQLGELIRCVDRGSLTREAVEAIEANRKKLVHLVKEGAKLTVVAPSMTFGIMHILSWLSGVGVDSTMVSTIFGSVVAADVLKSVNKKSTLASS